MTSSEATPSGPRLHARAVGAALPDSELSWTPATVALYHLGIGAGAGDPAYTLEDRLRPLASFAALACFPALIHLDEVDGLGELDLARVLHGEHRIALSRPIPTSGSVRTTGEIVSIDEKQSGALVAARQVSRWEDGRLAWTNEYKMFARGARAPGLRADPEPSRAGGPAGAPAAVVHTGTTLDQALLYRHSGDDNPLHLDREYARAGGFDVPILQGLCTLGMSLKAVVDALAGGEQHHVREVAVRFTGAVVPGETVTTTMWRTADGAQFTAAVGDREVLGRGHVAFD
jgi:acyl dehydratase